MVDLTHFIDEDRGRKVRELRKKREEEKRKFREKIKQYKLNRVNFPGFQGKINDLIDAVRSVANYANLKGYVQTNIIPDNPGIDYRELSVLIGSPPGVALVILHDLYHENEEAQLRELEKEYGEDLIPYDFEDH
ncbi:MAG: hypothetical protein ACTSVB_04910 [Candidatus Heimdallarchaeaceae archaeon]